jgi:hypothetical protein
LRPELELDLHGGTCKGKNVKDDNGDRATGGDNDARKKKKKKKRRR